MTQDEIDRLMGYEVITVDLTKFVGKELVILNRDGWGVKDKKKYFPVLIWKQKEELPQSRGIGEVWTGKWVCKYFTYIGTKECFSNFESRKKLINFLQSEAEKYFNSMGENEDE